MPATFCIILFTNDKRQLKQYALPSEPQTVNKIDEAMQLIITFINIITGVIKCHHSKASKAGSRADIFLENNNRSYEITRKVIHVVVGK